MWEYTRTETRLGDYRPEIFFNLLNNMGQLGWEISYNEVKHKDDYSFVVIMKRKIK